MSVFTADAGDLYFRTVRMRVTDWERFRTAFEWLMEYTTKAEGCASVICYRSTQDPQLVCIVEYWESPEAIEASYATVGDVPWQFMERAGNPEYLDDVLWQHSDIGEVTGPAPRAEAR